MVESAEHTVPQETKNVAIGTLRVAVVRGPDLGLRRGASSEILTIGTANGNDVVLSDPTVSRYHLELKRTPQGILVRDLSSTNGTRIGSVRVLQVLVGSGAILDLGDTTLEVGKGEPTPVEFLGSSALGGLRGRTEVMRRLLARVQRAAQSDVSVLQLGESGTGKELIARAMHDLGARAGGMFVTVDCGALSPTLVASELFGHEKGAFTGADRQHIGAFERAHGGTLFLDEVGELPQSLQATMLGVLERKRFRRLGGGDEISVDVRIVSATHRDLRADINAGRFRLDLYYRIAVVLLRVPPLRERLDDISVLLEHFARECGYSGPMEALISESAIKTLYDHHWPGNVRELRNWVEASIAMGEVPELLRIDLPGTDAEDKGLLKSVLGLPYKEARSTLLHKFERHYLKKLVDTSDGNVSQAARQARMDRSHLNDLLRRHGLR